MEKYEAYIETGCLKHNLDEMGIYPRSIRDINGVTVFMVDIGDSDLIIATGDVGFIGDTFEAGGKRCVKAMLNHENACVLRRLFTFTAPVPVLKEKSTVGVGDRLGIATFGHIRAFEKYDAFPVFAQQSIRELNLTGRNYENVLDSASFAVYREGFTHGFGADGDHLKTPEEVSYAISCGYTMITLDCSEHIQSNAVHMSDDDVTIAYRAERTIEEKYVNKVFSIGDLVLKFDEISFKRMYLIYGDVISFVVSIYDQFIVGSEKKLDFEISIDETTMPTNPAQHFFVANELICRGVKFESLASRYCGEFQKGVDYRGDLVQFEKEFAVHVEIAKYFGYKISLHSGSDKFSVFPIVGKYSEGYFHVKTAGTSWLEAMLVVARKDPALYREIHAFALAVFEEAKKYYHVSADLTKIPTLDTLDDDQLPGLFKQDDARQLIHITYGLILNEQNTFRQRLFSIWRTYAEEYTQCLDTHISRHLELLQVYKNYSL